MLYLITIFDRSTNCISTLQRDDKSLTQTIDKELGGWDNLHTASTGGSNSNTNEYMQAGTTKDDSKVFSILAIN